MTSLFDDPEFKKALDQDMDDLAQKIRDAHEQLIVNWKPPETPDWWFGGKSDEKMKLYFDSKPSYVTQPGRLHQIVERLKYKPNARIWVEGESMVVIAIDVPNRHKVGEIVDVTSRQPIPEKFAPDSEFEDIEFVRWVYYQVRCLEEHEMDEWFAFDGELLNDPHAGEVKLEWKNQLSTPLR